MSGVGILGRLVLATALVGGGAVMMHEVDRGTHDSVGQTRACDATEAARLRQMSVLTDPLYNLSTCLVPEGQSHYKVRYYGQPYGTIHLTRGDGTLGIESSIPYASYSLHFVRDPNDAMALVSTEDPNVHGHIDLTRQGASLRVYRIQDNGQADQPESVEFLSTKHGLKLEAHAPGYGRYAVQADRID